LKKLGIASNNESYVINALQFVGIIDEEGKKTEAGADAFSHHKDEVQANFEAYLEKYPDGEFRSLAEIRLADFPDASVTTHSDGNDRRG
jgi:hypothetical protein